MEELVLRQPWWLLLALVPWLFLAWQYWQQRRSGQAYADEHLLAWVRSTQAASRGQYLRMLLQILGWAGFAIALAGPRTPNMPSDEAAAQLNVMAVVDVSRSMQATDITPQRLQRAKLELQEWLLQRPSVRLGMVVYAARPHVLVPMSADLNAVGFYLQQLDSLQLPTRGSDAVAALGFAQQQWAKQPESGLPRVLLWLTDGDIPASQLPALQQAITKLKQANITVYILGIGTVDGAAIPLAAGGWLQHDGQLLRSRLNSALLQDLASQTGGDFALVQADSSEWQQLYQQGMLQQVQASEAGAIQSWHEWYGWVLLPSVLLLLLAWQRPQGMVLVWLVLLLPLPLPANETALQAGVEAYRANDYAKATEQFTAAIFAAQDDAARARAIYNLGNSYFQQGNFLAAQQAFADVSRYQEHHPAAAQNLVLTRQVLAAMQAQQQATGQAEGWAFERSSNALDWEDDSSPKWAETELRARVGVTNTVSPAHNLQHWVARGMLYLQQHGEPSNATWRQQQDALAVARLALQQPSQPELDLWQRLFALEEGFPTARKQPETLPEVLPW